MSEIAGLMPILAPVVGGLWVLLLVALRLDDDPRWPGMFSLAFLGLSGASALSLLADRYRADLFDGALLVDAQAMAFHLIFVIAGMLTVLASIHHLRAEGYSFGEFFALVQFAVAGMSMMAASENLLTIFLGLELLSISLYVLAGFTRDRVHAIEGALKYFLLGAFATGFLLYGIALFFGISGRVDLPGIAAHISAERGAPLDPLVAVAAALLVIGLAFKIAAVPFHSWAPDAYQGSMAPVSGFMAAGTKAAAFAALLRVLGVALDTGPVHARWMGILHVLALLTMIVGNLVALAQQNIKRMLAYSSIANAGYILVAIVSAGPRGPGRSVVLFYLAVYAFMTIGAFSVAAILGRAGEGEQGYALSAYAGLYRRRPWLAGAMAIFMLSLTGIPPTAGFLGKFYIFKAAIEGGRYDLAVVGVLASGVGAFFYLRVITLMYVRDPGGDPGPGPLRLSEAAGIFAAALATIAIGLFPSLLLAITSHLA